MIDTQVSSPIRSASASGPSGCANPSLAMVSIASASATPSCNAQTASLMKGIRIRLETNPGTSFATAGVLPSSGDSDEVVDHADPDAHLVGGWTALLGELGEALGHRRERSVGCAGLRVMQRNVPPGGGHDLCDPAAHLPCADDEDVLEVHGLSLFP